MSHVVRSGVRDSLPITLINALFSSFSLWFSCLKSCKFCQEGRGEGEGRGGERRGGRGEGRGGEGRGEGGREVQSVRFKQTCLYITLESLTSSIILASFSSFSCVKKVESEDGKGGREGGVERGGGRQSRGQGGRNGID